MTKTGIHHIISFAALAIMCNSCVLKSNSSSMQEEQLTTDNYGHMLNSIQVFSPDDEWVVYDTRNDQTHISRTCCLEMVNIHTGEIVKLYKAPGQSIHGPGVGAAAWHPVENKIIFIHGLLNCDESNPYSFTRRFGALLETSSPFSIKPAEARAIVEPLVPGGLRGGTHAHSWSGDGQWISFTYNDFLLEQIEKRSGRLKDLRTIGVMAPVQQVKIEQETAENFSGDYFSVVAATVTENPSPGSDEIEKAFDECWIGTEGYIKKNGSRQKRAIAFQGHVRTSEGSLLTEIFVADIPENVQVPAKDQLLQGTVDTRPTVPSGLKQRRVTFTENRKFPGIQGPRCWLRSSPDGSLLYFPMKDEEGIVQVFEVSVHGGEVRKVTALPAPLQAQFNLNADGSSIALIADNSIWVADVNKGTAARLTERTNDADAPVLAVNWNHTGDMLVYNRYAGSQNERNLQIYKLKLN